MSQYLTSGPLETKKLGKLFAQRMIEIKSRKALFVGLLGDLGGGKTTFIQGISKGLGIKEKILSPTFVIMKRFKVSKEIAGKSSFRNFYHIDCYRIKKPKELLDLGLKKILSNPENIVFVEWAEKMGKNMFGKPILIEFIFEDKKIRKIKINSKKFKDLISK